jgi:hypothetical protein
MQPARLIEMIALWALHFGWECSHSNHPTISRAAMPAGIIG